MMRITNAMMTSNTKNNININKLNEDRLNTQIATGQVISRPSEDPVVAIRALRLNTNLSQLTQYYKKNIPDAQAWMNVTETALKQTDQIFTNIKENLTTGASDNHTATDRQKILESLKGLRAELYSSGNADYAERTVFTGYRTGESLTFLETDKDLNENYAIHETFDLKALENTTYIRSAGLVETSPGVYETSEAGIEEEQIYRIRLAYDNLKDAVSSDPATPGVGKIVLSGGASTASITVETVSITGMSQQDIDKLYTVENPTYDPAKAYLIPETGEIIFGNAAQSVYGNYFLNNDKATASFEYNKDQWKSGDLRPEHYFACKQTVGSKTTSFNYDQDTGLPDFHNQDIEVEISFNQKITINTHANEVYTHDIGRDIDELIKITQSVVDADERVSDLEKKLAAASDAAKPDIQKELDTVKKEYSLKKDKMQKMFSAALDTFEGYADRNNVAIANIGSLQSRLTITKERVADQLQSFKELADANINAELTESSIDFASAKLALEAAQLAAGKIAQQTLLNYL